MASLMASDFELIYVHGRRSDMGEERQYTVTDDTCSCPLKQYSAVLQERSQQLFRRYQILLSCLILIHFLNSNLKKFQK